MYTREKASPQDNSLLIVCIAIIAGIILGFGVSRIFFTTFTLPDAVMTPDAEKGDTAVIFRFSTPEKNSVVALRNPLDNDRVLIRKVIAVPGDSVELRGRILYINDTATPLPVASGPAHTPEHPQIFSHRDTMAMVKLGTGEFFVMSNTFDHPFDSRYFGPVKKDSIIGTVVYSF
jgi:signal peptidase I